MFLSQIPTFCHATLITRVVFLNAVLCLQRHAQLLDLAVEREECVEERAILYG